MKTLTTLITALLLPLFAHANTPLPATGEGGTAQRGVREKGHASVLIAQADRLATKVVFDIPAGELTDALKALARQTGTDLVYRPEQVEGHKTPGLKGEYTAKDAITKLLKGTPLRLSTNTAGAMLIAEPKPIATSLSRDEKRGEAITLAQADQAMQKVEGQKTEEQSSTEKKNGEATSDASTEAEESNSSPVKLEEIVVTAQKRAERLQDVPAPVSVVRTEALTANNETRLVDYFQRIPGLNVSPDTQSAQFLSIRGLTTGAGNPTVGVVVDDVPYGGTISGGGGLVVPDIDPSELQRIEVLRGPQGTLYGAASLGGLFKMVTVDPSPDQLSARLRTGMSTVEDGDSIGYQVRGSVNVPLSETLAIRASGFYRDDPGYVDDPVRGREDINQAEAEGGRLSLLWANSAVKVKLSALYQRITGDGTAGIFTSLGDLQQNFSRGLSGYDRKTQAYSATITADLGFTDLTSISGYNINSMTDGIDYTFVRGAAARALFGPAATDAPYVEDQETEKFTQEVRLSVPLTERINWLIGGFYTDEKNSWFQQIQAYNPTTGEYPGTLLSVNFPTTYEEYAVFSNIAVELSDRFDIQLGARQAWNKQTYDETLNGALLGNVPRILSTRHSDLDAFTYLATARYRANDELMLYARVASGYQAGGPNTSLGGGPSYDPSTTVNYEIGAKGDLIEHVLSFDISAYHIDWKDIQLTLVSASGGYKVNGSGAKSQGVELSLENHPWTGMVASGFVAYNNAELTKPFATTINAYGQPGDRLPLSARWTANLSVEQSFALVRELQAYVGASASYVGDRIGQFRGFGPLAVPLARQEYPDYTRIDLRTGLRRDDWSVNLFVNNLTDRRGILNGGLGTFDARVFQILQPRTIGVSFAKDL